MKTPKSFDHLDDSDYWYPEYLAFERDYRDHVASHVADVRKRFEILEAWEDELMERGYFQTWFCEDLSTGERDQFTATWRDGHDEYLRRGRIRKIEEAAARA